MAVKRLRILFDGTEVVETPIGWQDIVSSIKRVKEINSLFITTDAQLTFKDDGYDYLMVKYNQSFTTSVLVELQEYVAGTYQTFFQGKIFLKSAVIDREQCTIQVEIEDNSFYAKIDNNKSIEVFPFAEQTKNAASYPTDTAYYLAPCDFVQVHLFAPKDGTSITPHSGTHTGASYPVFNLFEYLISFMTDNTMGFVSPLFGTGGNYEGLLVTCGKVLMQYQYEGTTEQDFKDNFPKISFQQLFTEVNKKIQIGMYVDYSYTIPTIVIDRAYNLRTDATMFRALNLLGLKERIDEEELFSSIRLGSTKTNNTVYASPTTGLEFPEDISFVGFKEEQFIVLGECNIDRELDLVSDWVISSNMIEDQILNNMDGNENDLFFIMSDLAGATYTARQSNLMNQALTYPVFYNLDLNGAAVMDNYFGGVPVSIAQYLGNNDNTFKASRSTDVGPVFNIYTNINCQNDSTGGNYDVNGNYNTGNGRYTIPISGLYTFELFIRQWYIPLNTVGYDTFYYIEHYDSLSNLIERRQCGYLPGIYGYSAGTYAQSFTTVAGDYLIATFKEAASFDNVIVLTNTYFSCINAVDGGGPYKTFEPEDYPVVLHEWEYPLTYADFKALATTQTGQIEFARHNEYHYSGWIDTVKYKRFSDEKAQFITFRSKRLPETTNLPPEIRRIHMIGQLADVPFDILPNDLYNNPFGGSSITNKVYFYLANTMLNITIPDPYLSCNFVNIYVTKYPTDGSGISATVFTNRSISFLVETNCNYTVQCTYDLTQVGNTWPSLLPEITPPVTVGLSGTAYIRLISPTVLADYTFLWSTGATTQSINAPAGNYTCAVTYVPGTFTNNIIIYNIQIPVSETGQ